jgi:hypothetical protein
MNPVEAAADRGFDAITCELLGGGKDGGVLPIEDVSGFKVLLHHITIGNFARPTDHSTTRRGVSPSVLRSHSRRTSPRP